MEKVSDPRGTHQADIFSQIQQLHSTGLILLSLYLIAASGRELNPKRLNEGLSYPLLTRKLR